MCESTEGKTRIIGDKQEVSRALFCLGLSKGHSEAGAEWYCNNIEFESMWDTELFSVDQEYMSLDDFMFEAYTYFMLHHTGKLGDDTLVEYISESAYTGREGKCAVLKRRFLEAAYSEDLITEDVAYMLKLDFQEAKKLFLSK